MTRRWWPLIAVMLLSLAACQSADEKARDAFRQRLHQTTRLTPEELRQLFDEIAPVIAGRKVRIKQGAITRDLNDQERDSVLGILGDPTAVYDSGLRSEGPRTWRGLEASGTPPLSEIDASQTLWIDVDSFLPVRYEFKYSMPGFGDYAYDLIVGQ